MKNKFKKEITNKKHWELWDNSIELKLSFSVFCLSIFLSVVMVFITGNGEWLMGCIYGLLFIMVMNQLFELRIHKDRKIKHCKKCHKNHLEGVRCE